MNMLEKSYQEQQPLQHSRWPLTLVNTMAETIPCTCIYRSIHQPQMKEDTAKTSVITP